MKHALASLGVTSLGGETSLGVAPLGGVPCSITGWLLFLLLGTTPQCWHLLAIFLNYAQFGHLL